MSSRPRRNPVPKIYTGPEEWPKAIPWPGNTHMNTWNARMSMHTWTYAHMNMYVHTRNNAITSACQLQLWCFSEPHSPVLICPASTAKRVPWGKGTAFMSLPEPCSRASSFQIRMIQQVRVFATKPDNWIQSPRLHEGDKWFLLWPLTSDTWIHVCTHPYTLATPTPHTPTHK